jgi:hypothetical protein
MGATCLTLTGWQQRILTDAAGRAGVQLVRVAGANPDLPGHGQLKEENVTGTRNHGPFGRKRF